MLDTRSVVIAVVVFLLGVAIGYAGDHSLRRAAATTATKATTTRTTATPKSTKASNLESPEGRQLLLSCLVHKDVPYLDPATANFKAPPPGVDDSTLNQALGACYRELVGGGG